MYSSPDTFPDKHPDTNRPYSITWVDDLGAGEQISSSAWSYEGDDTALNLTSPSIAVPLTSVIISGGTLGAQYKVKNTIVTNSSPPKTIAVEKYLNIREVNG